MNAEEIINAELDKIVDREKGFVNRAEDRGGPTKYGVTWITLGEVRKLGRNATAADVAALELSEARAILRKWYIERPGLLLLASDPAVFDLLVDVSVQHGPKRAVQFLQRSLGVKDDGIFGEITRSALIAKGSFPRIYRDVLAERLLLLGRWISGDHTDADHDGVTDTAELAAGLLARMASFVRSTP